jgi:glycosyltransferase involved in cell wall biosynthesis
MSRKKIALLFYFDPSWMGGIIYIKNIINTLNSLDDELKPHIALYYNPNLEKHTIDIEYPYIEKFKYNFYSISKRYLLSWLHLDNIFLKDILLKDTYDSVFPVHDFPFKIKEKTKGDSKLICWYADLQFKYYPQYFKWHHKLFQELRIKQFLRNADKILLSSNSVLSDFQKYYTVDQSKFNIFHFVSFSTDFTLVNRETLLAQYSLPDNYFIVSNQWHPHKNHILVLEAIHQLSNIGIKIHVAFTGKLPANSKAHHINEINRIIDLYNLKSQITILGLIPRNDQLNLMKYANAVIQPSFFEGWSTVVEDAMAVNTPVIASSLDVNIEQLADKGLYFDPGNLNSLVSILRDYVRLNYQADYFGDYDLRVKNASGQLYNLLFDNR